MNDIEALRMRLKREEIMIRDEVTVAEQEAFKFQEQIKQLVGRAVAIRKLLEALDAYRGVGQTQGGES